MPIYAGLIKVAEIQAGAINHAIRFTARVIQPTFAWPASHLVTGRECNPAAATAVHSSAHKSNTLCCMIEVVLSEQADRTVRLACKTAVTREHNSCFLLLHNITKLAHTML